MGQKEIIVDMVMFDGMTQLDFTGPYEIFARMPNTKVHLIAASLDPVRTQHGLTLLPDTTFDTAPQSTILFVPGGSPGVDDNLGNDRLLSFLQTQAATAASVTAVCTGALLLGAAGLLDGYRAATHWMAMDFLTAFGAIPVHERIVNDRNRITGGGVTAGIDVALAIAAATLGDEAAKEIQLFVEYDPQPPFDCGSPRTADPALVEQVRTKHAGQIAKRVALVQTAAQNLKL